MFGKRFFCSCSDAVRQGARTNLSGVCLVELGGLEWRRRRLRQLCRDTPPHSSSVLSDLSETSEQLQEKVGYQRSDKSWKTILIFVLKVYQKILKPELK